METPMNIQKPEPIEWLRSIKAACELGVIEPDDLQKLATGLTRYFAAGEAGKPISLEVSYGITQVGRHSWWTKERKRRRDALLREVCQRRLSHYASSWDAARAMQGLLRRQAIAPEDDGLVRMVMDSGGAVLGIRQLHRILS
jgi:hypothetical protein